MPVLLKSSQSASREEAVKEMKDCRSMEQHWCEAITSTCWDFVFCRSEAGHYRVPVLHAALCKKPLSDLEDAGVGSIDGILRFAQTHSYLISDTRFAFSLSYHLLLRVGQDRRSLGPDPARDLQVLTCFWDERPCWRVPPSSAELCFFFGSRYRG
ncbi:hypothetical protein F2Q70_00043603 [Brassica cretica]|uniref:Uncharacterized protein n=1 Tax=Brassica cretica TaxID=69181 RepID=A0A8S9KMG3_BRACR|nr:hypothetical protein F2Q70_00043603 [Brassica cretica]